MCKSSMTQSSSSSRAIMGTEGYNRKDSLIQASKYFILEHLKNFDTDFGWKNLLNIILITLEACLE